MRAFWWQSGLLAIAWTFIYGEISPYQLAVGFILAAVLLTALRGYYDTGKKQAPGRLVRRAWYAFIYLFVFAKDLTIANIDVAKRILSPRLHIYPGIVAVPIPTESDLETTLVGSSITLTPGELVVDVDPDRQIFYVHCIDARDPDTIRAEILACHEKYQARIFR